MPNMCDHYVSYGWIVHVKYQKDGQSTTQIRYYIGVDKMTAMMHAAQEAEQDGKTVLEVSIQDIPRCYVAIPAYMELVGTSPSDLR